MKINEVFVPDVLPIIRSKCSDIIEIYKHTKKCLWRGINSEKRFIKGNPPQNRRPMSMDANTSSILDDCLIDAGFTALRQNSIFCCGDINNSGNYGVLFIVFPYNGFDFTYGNTHDIFWDFTTNITDKEIVNLSPEQIIKRFGFRNVNLAKGLRDEVEIYIHGPYIALNMQSTGSEQNRAIVQQLLGFDAYKRA